MRKENGIFHKIQGFCSPQDRAPLVGETQAPLLSLLTPQPLFTGEACGISVHWVLQITGLCPASPADGEKMATVTKMLRSFSMERGPGDFTSLGYLFGNLVCPTSQGFVGVRCRNTVHTGPRLKKTGVWVLFWTPPEADLQRRRGVQIIYLGDGPRKPGLGSRN